MRILFFSFSVFYCVESVQALGLAYGRAPRGDGLKNKHKSVLSAWTHFFKKNTVSSNHKRAIKVKGSAWQISVVLDKKTSKRIMVNTIDDVCKEQSNSGGWNVISMQYQNDTLCFAGEGFETRASSTVIMIETAMKILHETQTTISSFDHKTVHIGDLADCTFDFAFALPWDAPENCSTILVPDFTFWAWPEAGLLPDYTTLINNLHHIYEDRRPQKEVCGWAGNPGMNQQRGYFIQNAQHSERFEFILPSSLTGTTGGRISMEDQARRWACLIDLPAAGFSGRVPMLLHSGRPVISVERTKWGGGHFTDNVWYAQKMVLGTHYLPVKADLTNLEETAGFALSEDGRKVGEQALEFAQNELTTEKAILGYIDALKLGDSHSHSTTKSSATIASATKKTSSATIASAAKKKSSATIAPATKKSTSIRSISIGPTATTSTTGTRGRWGLDRT